MKEDLKSKTCLVIDHGLFCELAIRLSRDFGRVLYYTPWEIGFPIINNAVIGDGFDEIERCNDFWPLLDEIDLFVFPDVQHSGLQLHLESLGKRVWGSRTGDSLELHREKFKKTQAELGMDVPKFKVVEGMTALRDYLMEHDNKFVKISKYRGMMETWHHINYKLSEPMLDIMAVKFGAVKELTPFLVEDPIDTDIEVGYDGYCIDGKFPSIAVQGYEKKDQGYICAIQKYEDMPSQVTEVNEAMAPALKSASYRNFFSTEIRVKGDKNFMIDPCCRCPSPATEAQMELYGNLGEIIWHGSVGEMVDPEPTAKFAVEVIIDHKGEHTYWRQLEIPDSVRQWVKLYSPCKVGDVYAIPPFPHSCPTIGVVIGIGDTIEKAIEHLHENADALGGAPVTVKTDALIDLLKEIHSAEEQGIEFTDDKVPKPETALT